MEIQNQNQDPQLNNKHLSHNLLWSVLAVLLLAVITGSYFWWQELKKQESIVKSCSGIQPVPSYTSSDIQLPCSSKSLNTGLLSEIQTNIIYKNWYESKKKTYKTVAEFNHYLKNSKFVMTREQPYNGEAVCQGEGFYPRPSPDGSKIACFTTGLEPDQDLFIYDKAKKISGVIQSCGTPCRYEDGFWLDNDRFVFLSSYEDYEFQVYKEFIVIQKFDFSHNIGDSWSAGVEKL